MGSSIVRLILHDCSIMAFMGFVICWWVWWRSLFLGIGRGVIVKVFRSPLRVTKELKLMGWFSYDLIRAIFVIFCLTLCPDIFIFNLLISYKL